MRFLQVPNWHSNVKCVSRSKSKAKHSWPLSRRIKISKEHVIGLIQSVCADGSKNSSASERRSDRVQQIVSLDSQVVWPGVYLCQLRRQRHVTFVKHIAVIGE